MDNHKCYDCGKILEPDEQLRFFKNDQASGQGEGYLCEACADQRLAEAPDPFYSEANMTRLLKSIQAAEAGKLAKHELIEVEDEE